MFVLVKVLVQGMPTITATNQLPRLQRSRQSSQVFRLSRIWSFFTLVNVFGFHNYDE